MEKEKRIRSGSKRYYWMRLKADFFESPEIKKLRKLAGGDTYVIIYLKMMLKTLQDDGVFIYKEIEDTFEKEVALIIDEDENNVMMTIAFLRNHNLLEEGYTENGFLLNAVPGLIGSETRDAERKRIARSMDQKAIETIQTDARADIVRQLSANVRNCPTEIEIEKEIEKERERELDTGQPARAAYGRYENVFLSQSELDGLKADLPGKWDYYIDRLSCHIASSGKRYKSHAATIYKWAQEDATKKAPKKGIPDYSCKEGESL